jgi:hypothetical protein
MTRRTNTAARAAAPLLVLLASLASGARAQGDPNFLPMVTDSMAVFPVPLVPQPQYTHAVIEPTFGTILTRIADDAGEPLGLLGSWWAPVARHVYSKQQPWNSSMTLLSLDNTGSGFTPVLLDGQGYQPVEGPCSNYDHWDARWHPKLIHAREQVNVNRTGNELMWFDVSNCVKTRSWILPILSDYGLGSGEGNVSNSGRFVAIANQHQMVVVDMDPPPNVAPAYPFRRIGPVYTFAACSLDVARPDSGSVNNVSISPSGRYIDVKYGGLAAAGSGMCDTLCDLHRIFEVDSGLVIRPHRMADASLRCGSFAARPNGWVYPLKHADMTLDPDDANEDVLIGGRACPGSTLGHVVKVRLRDGKVTSLTDPTDEAAYSHGSARNVNRPGWFYVTYSRDPIYEGDRFFGEVVAVRTDGSGSVQRFGHYHSTAATYSAEAQAVPSPDGLRVVFASDWADHVAGSPPPPGARAFVFDARAGATLGVPGPAAPSGLRLVSLSPNPTPGGLLVRFVIPQPRPAALELYDLAGRRLAVVDAGTLGVGEHVLDLDPDGRLEAGVYFVTLTDGRERRSARAVVLR